MSKRDLKKYLQQLDKNQIEEQLLELYDKFPEVKTYYNFVFNPREDKLVQEAKAKMSNEYFPIKSKRPRLRRSVAHKYIKHFLTLGLEPHHLADVMLFNIETALKYSAKRDIRYESFYKSMLTSFRQAVDFIMVSGIISEYKSRLESIAAETKRQKWINCEAFENELEKLHL